MECMSFNQLFIIPQNLLASATAASNGANGVVTDQNDAAATCNPSNAEWEPAINLFLALGMIVMILVSVLSAYMEAMLYLKSHQSPSANSCKSAPISANRANNNSSNNNNNNNNSGITSSISAPFSHRQQQNSNSLPRFTALSSNGNKTIGNHLQNGGKNNKHNANNIGNNTNNNNNNNSKNKRKNSSSTNNEKSVTNNSKSISSTTSDKKSSNICAPMFQNLTNVIASPPPPLPAFDSEEFGSSSLGTREDEFKKFRGKKAAKKSKKCKKESQTNSSAEADNPTQLEQLTVLLNHQPETTTTAATCSSSSSSSASLSSANSLVSSTKSSASTSSSSSTSSNKSSAPSTTPSSTSSSPPLSASSYGEYSLLGPGVTFELPCLRVRSAQT